MPLIPGIPPHYVELMISVFAWLGMEQGQRLEVSPSLGRRKYIARTPEKLEMVSCVRTGYFSSM